MDANARSRKLGLSFNSTLVQLKADEGYIKVTPGDGFNSTLVQLKGRTVVQQRIG